MQTRGMSQRRTTAYKDLRRDIAEAASKRKSWPLSLSPTVNLDRLSESTISKHVGLKDWPLSQGCTNSNSMRRRHTVGVVKLPSSEAPQMCVRCRSIISGKKNAACPNCQKKDVSKAAKKKIPVEKAAHVVKEEPQVEKEELLPVACQVDGCPEVFVKIKYLNNHLIEKHCPKEDQEKNQAPKKEKSRRKESTKQEQPNGQITVVKCNLCDNEFFQKGTENEHYRTVHNVKRPENRKIPRPEEVINPPRRLRIRRESATSDDDWRVVDAAELPALTPQTTDNRIVFASLSRTEVLQGIKVEKEDAVPAHKFDNVQTPSIAKLEPPVGNTPSMQTPPCPGPPLSPRKAEPLKREVGRVQIKSEAAHEAASPGADEISANGGFASDVDVDVEARLETTNVAPSKDLAETAPSKADRPDSLQEKEAEAGSDFYNGDEPIISDSEEGGGDLPPGHYLAAPGDSLFVPSEAETPVTAAEEEVATASALPSTPQRKRREKPAKVTLRKPPRKQPAKCAVCEKSFEVWSKLMRHLTHVHSFTGEAPRPGHAFAVCFACSKAFDNEERLKR